MGALQALIYDEDELGGETVEAISHIESSPCISRGSRLRDQWGH